MTILALRGRSGLPDAERERERERERVLERSRMGDLERVRLRSRMLRDLERVTERAPVSRVSSIGVGERPRETLRRSDMLVDRSVVSYGRRPRDTRGWRWLLPRTVFEVRLGFGVWWYFSQAMREVWLRRAAACSSSCFPRRRLSS